MFRGNAFLVGTTQQGPRGRTALSLPHMFMGDFGASVGDHHYFNLDLMLTAERWSIPNNGYPELLQIGEENASGQPFIDAQHPHSSPIMGLTLSDTIALSPSSQGSKNQDSKNHIKIFFAPRGEATDGPMPFMHRPTGMVNPDAPLGHHIGQDVGHVTSTVLGGSLKLGDRRFEASIYHGAEPRPTQVDLPLGVPDSFSLRLIEEFSPDDMAMASYGWVHQPEPDQPSTLYESRVSVSFYARRKLGQDWGFYNTFIFGRVTQYDNTSSLMSFAEEFLFRSELPRIWGRVEVLQRSPNELGVITAGDANQGLWVAAFTLGYTHRMLALRGLEFALGSSATVDVLPVEYASAYGGNPWTGKVFLQMGGMGMWDLF